MEEEDESVVGSGSGPAAPLPSLISVIESASTSDNELGDSKTSSPPSPPRSIPPSSSPTYMSDYELGGSKTSSPPSPPRSFSITPPSSPPTSTSGLDLGDSKTSSPPSPPRSLSIPPSSSPTSTSDYELRNSKTSSPPSPPRSISIPSSSSPTSTSDYELGDSKTSSGKLRANKIPSSSPKQSLEISPLSPHPISAHDDDVHIYEDDDADQFMDQFMEHYDRLDREEDQRDYAQGPIKEEVKEVMVSLGERVVLDEGGGGDEIQMKLPPPRNNGSRFFESEDDDDDDDNDHNDEDQDQEDDDEDDDMPLAQRIPGALTAQKTIRSQVRQEREKKKQEKALRNHAETTRTRLTTLRPGAVPSSSSHDTTTTTAAAAAAALVASQTTTTTQRISRTLTRKDSRSWNPFSREDSVRKRDINGPDGVEAVAATTTSFDATSLYQRLHSLHRSKSTTRPLRDAPPPSTEALPPVPIPQNRLPSSQPQRARSVKEPSSLPYQFPTSPSPTPINSAYAAPSSITPLRPTRSFHFHRPSIDRRPIGMDDPSSVPLPVDAEKRISQISTNITRSRSSTRDGPQPQQPPSAFPTATPTHHHRSLSRSRSVNESVSSITIPESPPLPPIPTTAKISHGEHPLIFRFMYRKQGRDLTRLFLQMQTSSI